MCTFKHAKALYAQEEDKSEVYGAQLILVPSDAVMVKTACKTAGPPLVS